MVNGLSFTYRYETFNRKKSFALRKLIMACLWGAKILGVF